MQTPCVINENYRHNFDAVTLCQYGGGGGLKLHVTMMLLFPQEVWTSPLRMPQYRLN